MLFIIAAAKSYCGLGDSKGYINLYVGTYTADKSYYYVLLSLIISKYRSIFFVAYIL